MFEASLKVQSMAHTSIMDDNCFRCFIFQWKKYLPYCILQDTCTEYLHVGLRRTRKNVVCWHPWSFTCANPNLPDMNTFLMQLTDNVALRCSLPKLNYKFLKIDRDILLTKCFNPILLNNMSRQITAFVLSRWVTNHHYVTCHNVLATKMHIELFAYLISGKYYKFIDNTNF